MKILTLLVIALLLIVCGGACFSSNNFINAASVRNNQQFHSLSSSSSSSSQQQYIIPANNEPNTTHPGSPNFVYFNDPKFVGEQSTVRVFTLKNPSGHWSVECPGCNQGDCSGVHKTVSTQAKNNNCLYATNAGPFSFVNGSKCFGPLVSNGRIISHAPPSGNRACMGIFKNSTSTTNAGHWYLGLDADAARDSLLKELDQLVCGFNFLVIDGKAQYSKDTEVAPRTAIGVDYRGNLVSVVADGAEKHSPPQGLTLNQTADLMLQFSSRYAINLDGGGSSTTWFEGAVRGCPTGIDIPICLEREVITTQCVK